MPLVVLCGRPCTGKTTFARALAAAARAAGLDVALVDDAAAAGDAGADADAGAAALPRAGARLDKVARARLRARVERALTHARAVVVADAGNGVKGFRYELWCAARNVGARAAVVWVGPDVRRAAAARAGVARARAGGAPAPARAVLRDVWARFEPPDARNRWDAPLVRVPLAGAAARAGVAALAAAAGGGVGAGAGEGAVADASAPSFWEQCAADAAAAREARERRARGELGGEGGAVGGGVLDSASDGDFDDDGDDGGGPFLTSRFELWRVAPAGALARELGGGAGVDAPALAAQRAARQLADAEAGYVDAPPPPPRGAARYGAVPARGFSRAAAAGAAPAAPDYFAPDFNGDAASDEDDGAGSVANMADFDEGGGEAAETAAPRAPAAASSFRRAGGAAAPRAAEAAAPPPLSAPAPPPAAADAAATDAIDNALRWLDAFCGGDAGAPAAAPGDADAGRAAASAPVAEGAPDARAAAAASSAALAAALAAADLCAPGAQRVDVGGAVVAVHLPRATSAAEVARLRRAFLAPGGDVGDGAAQRFAAFLTRELRRAA